MLLALIDHRIDLPRWAFVESLVPQPFVGFVARGPAFVLIAHWMDWGEGGYLGPEKAFVRTEQRSDPADHLDDQVEKLYFWIVPFGLESCRHHQSHCHAYHLGLCHGGPSSHHMQARASICPRMMQPWFRWALQASFAMLALLAPSHPSKLMQPSFPLQ